jgi:cytochrome c556
MMPSCTLPRGVFLVIFGALVAFSGACAAPPAQPSSTQTATPATAVSALVVPQLSINASMVAFVDHAAHNLWEVEREGRAPKTDADWEIVAEHAIQLAAAGPAISAGGTGPTDALWAKSASWRAHAQNMSDAGVAALRAAQARNLDQLIAANGKLVESCEACHKEFKPAIPSEGITHGHAHDAPVKDTGK